MQNVPSVHPSRLQQVPASAADPSIHPSRLAQMKSSGSSTSIPSASMDAKQSGSNSPRIRISSRIEAVSKFAILPVSSDSSSGISMKDARKAVDDACDQSISLFLQEKKVNSAHELEPSDQRTMTILSNAFKTSMINTMLSCGGITVDRATIMSMVDHVEEEAGMLFHQLSHMSKLVEMRSTPHEKNEIAKLAGKSKRSAEADVHWATCETILREAINVLDAHSVVPGETHTVMCCPFNVTHLIERDDALHRFRCANNPFSGSPKSALSVDLLKTVCDAIMDTLRARVIATQDTPDFSVHDFGHLKGQMLRNISILYDELDIIYAIYKNKKGTGRFGGRNGRGGRRGRGRGHGGSRGGFRNGGNRWKNRW
jgi:uncharacterized membrane protein YgcG